MTLTRLHHVGIVVREIDEALGFYRDVLGLSVGDDRILADEGVRGLLLPLENFEIELIQPIVEGNGVARFLEARGEGLHHLCFETDDVAADLRAARAKGMAMIDETPRVGLAGRIGFIHPKANHGVLIEFAQPPPGPRAGPPLAGGPAVPQRLRHAVCAVADCDRAGRDFIDRFGMRDAGRRRVVEEGLRNWLLDLGDTRLELVEPIGHDPRNPLHRQISQGEGLFMLALSVRDVVAAVEHLRAHEVTCTDARPPQAPVAFLSPRDTHGVRIALDQGAAAAQDVL